MYKKVSRRSAFLVTFWLVSWCVMAQGAFLKVSIDSSMLLIGEQSLFHVSLTSPKDAQVELPFWADTLVTGIEIVERKAADTTFTREGLMQLTQDYLVTSFDSGLYYMPPFKAVCNGDTILSNPLALKVVTIPIDSASIDMMRDIKEVMNPPFVWKDYMIWIYILLLLVLLGAVGYYGWKHAKFARKATLDDEPAVWLPPHIEALQHLDRIKEEKMWQHGLEKEYFTALVETLKVYIARRYEVDAVEMTSDEVLTALVQKQCEKGAMKYVKQLFSLADLVKFAKFKPLPDENDISLSNAYHFVEETKQEETTEGSEGDPATDLATSPQEVADKKKAE